MTVMTQLPFDGIVPPVNLIPAEPRAKAEARLFCSVPEQLLVVAKSATVIAPGAVGKVSTNVAPVKATELPLNSVITKVVVPVVGKIGLV